MRLAEGVHHASAVRLDGRGILILGASGSGKSSLALALMGLGADLIADDRVSLQIGDDGPHLARPQGVPGLIECRGVGLLKAACVEGAPLGLVVARDIPETERLPPLRWAICGDLRVPLFHNVTNSTFPMAIRQYFLHGRKNPDS